MSWLRWCAGRTSPFNYQKMLLIQTMWFDLYILRFRTGSSIDWHRDPLSSSALEHHRINFFLQKAKKGGRIMSKRLVLDGEKRGAVKLTLKHKSRIDYMRPDVTEHAVEKVEEGTAYVLSLGWVRHNYD